MPTAFSLHCSGGPLRVILALAMALTPLAATHAQTRAAETLDTRWLTPETVAVGYLRPRQVLTAEGAELLPLEIFAAAGKKYFGIDPVDVKSITVAVEPMTGPEPVFAVVVESTKPFDKSGLSPEITEHTEQAELNGKTYLKSRNPQEPSFFQLNESTLIVGTDSILRKLVAQGERTQSSPLISAIKSRPASDDLYVAVDVKSLRPLINMALAAQAKEVPPEFQKYLQAPEFVRLADIALNLSTAVPPALHVYANDERAAKKLESLVNQAKSDIEARTAALGAMQLSEDPIVEAFVKYNTRRIEQTLDAMGPIVAGDKLTFFPADPNQEAAQMQQIAAIGIFVTLFMTGVRAAQRVPR